MSRKRLAASDPSPDSSDSSFWNKRGVAESTFDIPRSGPAQIAKLATPTLDTKRAETSRQHVRALNVQFASWVQTQLKNHPDELWEDGVRDYITHASGILEKFSDVVNWLKENTSKVESLSSAGPPNGEKESVPKQKDAAPSFPQTILSSFPVGSTSVPRTSGIWNNSQTTKPVLESNENVSSLSQNPTNSTSGVISSFPASWSSGLFNSSEPTKGIFNLEKKGLPEINSNEAKSSEKPAFLTFSAATNASSSSPWSSVFSGGQTPVFSGSGIQTSAPANQDASEEGDGEAEQPSSPSVKRSEEHGVTVVHEVKCKIYVKSSDPADADAWKDRGAGQLYIKCKEGFSKGSKESKPTVLVRNDVGKILLNALIYPGIKTSLQKNSIVAIFHTVDDANNNVVARTFLIRTKSEEDRNKLAAAIQECAPSS
ncbi:hypothetical protein SAY86_012603 [Trapa natans]|uniref:RanBD1 domain-containing protein n=1 Tax=Trapa natans TaxID=22666 RepID=A0AAN7M022_TRANT|nr:hypothetical protein SAY86_012603 [Trapa natans]